jgi:hypothetical protein
MNTGSKIFMRNGFKSGRLQQGYDIVQLSIVIAIIAVLTILMLVLVKGTRTSGTATAAAGTFSSIAQSTRKAASGANGYSGFTAPVLINLGVIPDKWVGSSGSTIVDDWGQTVTTAVTTMSGGSANAMLFTFPAVPSAACPDFVNQAAAAADLITVGGTSVKNVSNALVNVSMATLSTACDAESGTTKAIAFTIGR